MPRTVTMERVRAHIAAGILGVEVRTVQALALRGELPGAAKIGGVWTFDADALRAFKGKLNALQEKKQKRKNKHLGRDTIYFAQCGIYIKIGYTRNLDQRIAALQTASCREIELVASFDGTKVGERQLHDLFREHHVRGEWFAYARTIKTWIRKQRGALP